MRYLKILFSALVLIACSSCEKDFIIDSPDAGKKMVVNSVFDNIRVFRVYVTESVPLTGSEKLNPLTDAEATIFEDGVLKEKLQYVPSDSIGSFGSYQSTFMPTPGKKYFLRVVHPIYGVSTAEDILPVPAVVTSYELSGFGPTPKDAGAIAKIRFRDDGGQQNYYRINIWMKYAFKQVDPVTGDSVLYTNYGGARPEMITGFADTVRDNGWHVLFSDKTFNGQSKEVEFFFRGMPTEYLEKATLYIELHTVTNTHYQYYRTLELYNNNRSAESEPVTLYSNVQNAYGIFAADAINTVEIPIK